MPDSDQVQQWIHEIKQGRTELLGRVCDHYRDKLRRMIALRMDQRLAARLSESDVVQEVYMEALRRIAEYQGNPQVDFYVWLRGLAIQRLSKLNRTHIQASKRSTRHEETWQTHSSQLVADKMLSARPGPLTNLIRQEFRHLMQTALDRLPADYREVIAMRHFEEMSNQEIAAALGLSESGATRRYGRALRELQKLLSAGNRPEGADQ